MDNLVHIPKTQEISQKSASRMGFEGWADMFGDAVLATALLDS